MIILIFDVFHQRDTCMITLGIEQHYVDTDVIT